MSLDIRIANERLEIPESLSLTIKYKLEDGEDFQKKSSDQAFNIKVPFTIQNQKVANNFQNPSQEDLSPDQFYRNPRKVIIIHNGAELLIGQAFMLKGSTDGYEYSFYGGNADWIIALKESTIYDFMKRIVIPFTKSHIISSFAYDGTNESLPYVFAPVKYRPFMDVQAQIDSNVESTYLKAAVSPYFVVKWALQSVGYRIQSTFMDTPYFRRMVMPWIWGNFLDSDGTKLQIHKFMAKSTADTWIENFKGEPDLRVTNDSTLGAYDNNNDYSYVNKRMVWEYKAEHFGVLDATFSCQISHNCTLVGSNSYCHHVIRWYHFDISAGTTTMFKEERIVWANGRNLVKTDIVGVPTFFATRTIDNGDKILCATHIDIQEGKGAGARGNNMVEVLQFQLDYFRIPLGGTINFENYIGLKKHKLLDLIGGLCDTFDLVFNTDNVNRIVTIEPAHPYSLDNNLGIKAGGYFNNTNVDWSNKKDISVPWSLSLYSDYEKELLFKFKPDNADGIVKVLQDRNLNTLLMGKYVFPDRFKAGKKEYTNRFFSPVAHYDCVAMKPVTGISPQLICIIPENISNTSNSESSNTFSPKLAYYKGEVTGVGGWKLDGNTRLSFPYMFAVNYKPGGHLDPCLSYSDERMDNEQIAKSLLKRFFWQRLAIMRNGQFYNNIDFKLNNNDVVNAHREFKIIDGNKYELIEVEGYKPLSDDSTPCSLRKWVPISQVDADNTYPSAAALALPVQPVIGNDIKYAQSKCLISDIP